MVRADEIDSINIDEVTVEECGEQSMTFTGTATYSESTQHLVVELDGVEVLYSLHEEENWSTGPVEVSEGSHTLVASIYDNSDYQDLIVQETVEFSTSCDESSDEGSSDEDSNGDDGEGDEQDCCPGPDEEVSQVKKIAKVKGAFSSNLWARLKPLNSIFRSVFGRTPTFTEWTYWANRLLTDKPQYDALLGAMQWHKLQGHTMGK